jgi:hypothetical protein
MKKIGITFMLAMCLSFFAQAQDYKTGIGVRGGFANGLTIKHFISSNTALEGIVASRWRGLELTGLFEIHKAAFNTERLKWFYGLGAHVGFWNGRYTHWGNPQNEYTVVGIDGILGLEYSFREIPFSLSVDWKPVFNFVGYSGFWGDGGAISLRYIF